jgi:hypothetical protein
MSASKRIRKPRPVLRPPTPELIGAGAWRAGELAHWARATRAALEGRHLADRDVLDLLVMLNGAYQAFTKRPRDGLRSPFLSKILAQRPRPPKFPVFVLPDEGVRPGRVKPERLRAATELDMIAAELEALASSLRNGLCSDETATDAIQALERIREAQHPPKKPNLKSKPLPAGPPDGPPGKVEIEDAYAMLHVIQQFGLLSRFGPFESYWDDSGFVVKLKPGAQSTTRAGDLRKLNTLMHFLARLMIGRSYPADWGRLRRMHREIESTPQAQQVRALELVRTAMKFPENLPWEGPREASAGGNLRAVLSWDIDRNFANLDPEKVQKLLENPGRRGAVALTAELYLLAEIERPVPGETMVRAAKRIAKRLEAAERALCKS